MALIYVVEDDNDILEIETFALKNSGHEVSGFSCGKDFHKAILEATPDLILLDIMLPDEDGLTILGKIRENPQHKDIPVIMVTAKTTEIDKVKGLDIGADDYITKPFGVMELIARVKALLRRSKGSSNEAGNRKILRLDEISIDDEKHAVSVDGKVCELTYKEYELLKLFIENKGIVFTRENLMNRIWGVDYVGETRTVDMHIKTLRQKLGGSGNKIKTVRNVGYLIEG